MFHITSLLMTIIFLNISTGQFCNFLFCCQFLFVLMNCLVFALTLALFLVIVVLLHFTLIVVSGGNGGAIIILQGPY